MRSLQHDLLIGTPPERPIRDRLYLREFLGARLNGGIIEQRFHGWSAFITAVVRASVPPKREDAGHRQQHNMKVLHELGEAKGCCFHWRQEEQHQGRARLGNSRHLPSPTFHSLRSPLPVCASLSFVAFYGPKSILICQLMASKVVAAAVVGVYPSHPRHILTTYRISPGFTPLSASEKVGCRRLSQPQPLLTLVYFVRDRCCSSGFPQASR